VTEYSPFFCFLKNFYFEEINDSSSGSTLENPSPFFGSGSFAFGTGTDRCGKVGRERPPHERGEALKRATPKRISFPAKDTHRTTAVAGSSGTQQQRTGSQISLSLAGKQREREGRTGVRERQVL